MPFMSPMVMPIVKVGLSLIYHSFSVNNREIAATFAGPEPKIPVLPARQREPLLKKRKSLGQHFLRDDNMAYDIAASITSVHPYTYVVEVGPGEGRLTRHLLDLYSRQLYVIELDERFAHHLVTVFPALSERIIQQDFLQWTPDEVMGDHPFVLIGNFPYYISTEILFRALSMRSRIPQIVGMFQKEVADRIAAPPGNKQYGVTSVLLTAFYEAEVLFDIPPHLFDPPPKVTSAVLRLTRLAEPRIKSDYPDFRRVVKMAFNQRRKTLRNALKAMTTTERPVPAQWASLRAEALSVEDFDALTEYFTP